jgi:ABC-2 type transport system ATP-binding protein
MTDEAVIVAIGLGKRFGDTVALQDLDLKVPAGRIFGYLGPNGSGKSTTIRLLLGLIRPTAGSATVLGSDIVSEREEIHRGVGYLPGDFAAYKELTGNQYLAYFAELRGGVGQSAIEALAERFELDLNRRIGTLSHGNRQKVGIVQAFMHEPDLLILDEPTQGLDPLMQNVFLDLLRETRDAGRTVFLSSHVLREVEEVADTVAIIKDGHLVTISDVAELKTRTRRRVRLTFADGVDPPVVELRSVTNVVEATIVDGSIELVVEGSMAEFLRVAAPYGVEQIVSDEVDLEGMFLQYYGGS